MGGMGVGVGREEKGRESGEEGREGKRYSVAYIHNVLFVANTHTHMRACTHIHAHTRTRTHTHTHTHTQATD